MRTNRGFRSSVAGLVVALAAGTLVPVHAVDFGEMMNPGSWLGGTQDQHGQERFESGYGVPGHYGQYGTQQRYGSDRYAQPFLGQPPYGYVPYGQPQFGQPGVRPESLDPGWSTDYGPRFPGPEASDWSYGGASPAYGAPGTRFEDSRASDHWLEQRVRDLERRVDALERRQHDGRRQSPSDFPQPEYPPLR